MAPEDDTTTTVYALDENNQIKSADRNEESKRRMVGQESHSKHRSEDERHNGTEDINFLKSHLDL